MITSLNLMKPVSKYEKAIAKKCGWVNADSLPVRKNLLPEGFVGSAKLEPEVTVIGTKLTPKNVVVMEILSANDKIARSPFVRTNLTDILKMANEPGGENMIKKVLTPETIDKLDTIRGMVRRHPGEYIKDRSQIKYVNTPAGLSALFNDVAMLKASAILDLDSLNSLFKLDVTQGIGKKLLKTAGKYDELHLDLAKKGLFKNAVLGASRKN